MCGCVSMCGVCISGVCVLYLVVHLAHVAVERGVPAEGGAAERAVVGRLTRVHCYYMVL